ncbi:MAG: hypothetical protein ACYTFG_07655 [Planctomycetota bacterium]
MKSIEFFAFFAVAILFADSGRVRGEDKGPELRIYDVRQLLNPVPDRPGPVFSLIEAEAPRIDRPLDWEVGGLGMGEDAAVLDEEELITAIRSFDTAADWDSPEFMLRIHHGRLFTRNTHEVLDRLGGFLTSLEEAAASSLCVRILVFGPPFPPIEEAAVVSEKDARRIEKAVRGGDGWYDELAVTALNGQRAFASKGTQFLHLSDFDPEVASGARIQDPVMAVGNVGMVLDARARLSPTGERVSMTLRLSCATPVEGSFESTVKTPSGRIHTPAVWRTAVQTTLNLRTGGFALIGVAKPGTGDAKRRGAGAVRILVEVSRVQAKEGGSK